MAEVILHVGMDKTGSSSIQHSFDGYDDGSMRYARLASANHSMPLTILFGDPRRPSRALKAQGLGAAELLAQRERHRSDLQAALNTGHDRVILSAEGVLSLDKSALVQLRDFLLTRADRICVLLKQNRRQSRSRTALLEERPRHTKPRVPPRAARFRLAAPVIRDALDPRDLEWMEERIDSGLLQLRNTSDEPGEFDIATEKQLIEIAKASAAYLQPILRRYEIAPRNRSTLAAMDAIFELAAASRS